MRCLMQDNVIKCRFDPYLYLGLFFFFSDGATTKSSPYEVLDGAREEFKGGQCLGLYAVSPHNGRLCAWPVGQVDEIRREKTRPQSVMEGAETSTEHGRAGGAIPSQRELMSERVPCTVAQVPQQVLALPDAAS